MADLTCFTYGFSAALDAVRDRGTAHRHGSSVVLRRTGDVPLVIVDESTGRPWTPTLEDLVAQDWLVQRAPDVDVLGC